MGISPMCEVGQAGDGPWGIPSWASPPTPPPTLCPCSGSRRCALCPGCCAHGTLPSWQDLAVLQDKLRISTKKLEEYETLFKCQEETTQKLVLEYQARLEEGEERLRRQQEDKDIQMKGIISRWGGLSCSGPSSGPAGTEGQACTLSSRRPQGWRMSQAWREKVSQAVGTAWHRPGAHTGQCVGGRV